MFIFCLARENVEKVKFAHFLIKLVALQRKLSLKTKNFRELRSLNFLPELICLIAFQMQTNWTKAIPKAFLEMIFSSFF